MKIFLLILPLFLMQAGNGFLVLSPQQQQTSTHRHNSKKTTDDIAHELEELGREIRPHILKEEHGFSETHEAQLHKLKRQLQETKHQWHEEVKDLKDQMNMLEDRLFQWQDAFQSNELQWQAEERHLKAEFRNEETQLLSDIFQHEKEQQGTFRFLLGQLVRLSGRRIRQGAKGLWSFATFKTRPFTVLKSALRKEEKY